MAVDRDSFLNEYSYFLRGVTLYFLLKWFRPFFPWMKKFFFLSLVNQSAKFSAFCLYGFPRHRHVVVLNVSYSWFKAFFSAINHNVIIIREAIKKTKIMDIFANGPYSSHIVI